MVNSKKVIAALGVVAGLGVAMLPLTSYAENPSDTTEGNVVRVKVADTLSVDVTATYSNNATEANGFLAVEQGESNTTTLTHKVEVKGTTYADYDLYIYAKNSETSLKHEGYGTNSNTAAIAPIASAGATLTEGWAYQYSDIEASDASSHTFGNWTPIQATAVEAAKIHAAGSNHTASYDDFYTVNFGVKAAENQLAGTYEGTVVYYVTAAASI